MYGFYRMAVCSPAIVPGDVEKNCDEILRLYKEAAEKGACLVFFPALALTGASVGELFFQQTLLDEAQKGMRKIASETTERTAVVFGSPVCMNNALYDCFVVAVNGEIPAVVPSPVYDKRFFSSPATLPGAKRDKDKSDKIIFDAGCFTFSIYEGAQEGYPGTDVVLVPRKENALPGKEKELRSFAENFSKENRCCCLLTSGNAGESTAGNVSSGASCIAENGRTVASIPLLHTDSRIIYSDIDISSLQFQRRKLLSDPVLAEKVLLPELPETEDLSCAFLSSAPYLPETEEEKKIFAEETLSIQSFALAHRMKKACARKMVLGISGGLDSTLALIVLNRSCELLNLPKSTILAVTMPGFGTTSRTKNNALLLAEKIGAEVRTISITEACKQHFNDIGHDEKECNAVYENTQARERTQILMDLANKENGLVIGTGDLSEISMGWCTYNGDQMSMYSVNSSIMKSVIPLLLKYEGERYPETAEILHDVIATPVSPELLPLANENDPGHCTEEILGAYEIHDFFIYAFCHWGSSKEKILYLAQKVFASKYDTEEVERCYKIFIKRFFTQQFKRSASPEGVNANLISLHPAEWKMPSDISGKLWF